MKRLYVVVFMVGLLSFNAFAEDQLWPELSREKWEIMTVEQLERLLQTQDVNARNEDNLTALMKAAEVNENPEIIDRLIAAGANVNMQDESGKTAWDMIQENEALKGTYAYRRLNDLLF